MNKFPSIHSQGYKTRAIAKDRLLQSGGNRHFNASILRIETEGRTIMAYRLHGPDRGRCQIAICDLDSAMMPSNSQVISLPDANGLGHFEDPRIFIHNNRVWMSYTETWGYTGNWTCSMRLAKLRREGNDWHVEKVFKLAYGLNDIAKEKNWTFFSLRGRLYFVYSLSPHVVVEVNDVTGDCLEEWTTDGIQNWQFGTLSGGTPPILFKGTTMLSMFHSALPHPERVRRYNASLYMFNMVAPFEIRQVTTPILYGSEEDGYMPDPRDHNIRWEPCVVFPCGGYLDGMGNYIASCGINDHAIAVVDVALDRQTWHSPVFAGGKRYFWTSNATKPLKMPDNSIVEWMPTRQIGGSWEGVMSTESPNVVAIIGERDGLDDIREIDSDGFALSFSRTR